MLGRRVLRILEQEGIARFEALSASGLLDELQKEDLIVGTRRIEPSSVGISATGLLEHDLVPVISYPYEWSFAMLQEAAGLTLEIQRRSLTRGFILKDATPFNVQFDRGRAVFIDIPSILPHADGQPWEGYTQFCSLFLFPLMLAAYVGVDFRPFLRGRLAGVSPETAARILGWRHSMQPGVFTHALAQSWLERRFKNSRADLRGQFSELSLPRAALVRQCEGLTKLVKRLRPRVSSEWLGYEEDGEAAYRESKTAFVRNFVSTLSSKVLIDLGANTGFVSAACADLVERIVAVDGDSGCIDRLHARVSSGKFPSNILPLVMDLSDPSPSVGWRLEERPSWTERIRPDAFLALALIHHISIPGNISLADVMAWFRSIASRGVIEFVEPTDPRAHDLLARKSVAPRDYNRAGFEAAAATHFKIADKKELPGGTRVIYGLIPR